MKFDEVMVIPDQEMRSICLNLPVPTLAKALHGAQPKMVEKFLGNIRPTWAEMIREMVSKQGSLSEAEIEAARAKILGIIEKSRAG